MPLELLVLSRPSKEVLKFACANKDGLSETWEAMPALISAIIELVLS